jgi:hypothetical protein
MLRGAELSGAIAEDEQVRRYRTAQTSCYFAAHFLFVVHISVHFTFLYSILAIAKLKFMYHLISHHIVSYGTSPQYFQTFRSCC